MFKKMYEKIRNYIDNKRLMLIMALIGSDVVVANAQITGSLTVSDGQKAYIYNSQLHSVTVGQKKPQNKQKQKSKVRRKK